MTVNQAILFIYLLFVDELEDIVDIADDDNLLTYHGFFCRQPVTYLEKKNVEIID